MATTGRPTTEAEITLWQRVTLSVRELDKTTTVLNASVVANQDEAAILGLKQIVWQVLSNLHKRKGKSKKESKPGHRHDEEAPTFPGEEFNLLHRRYPKAHLKGKPQGYVPLNELTEDDWNWNADHQRDEVGAKAAHNAQFLKWGVKIRGFTRKKAS